MATPTSNGQVAEATASRRQWLGCERPKTCVSPCAPRRSTTSTDSPRPRSPRASGCRGPTAGRLIARAKARGLVRIEVVVPPTLQDDLHADEERELEAALRADRGRRHRTWHRPGARPTRRVRQRRPCRRRLLMRRLSADDVLGFTWGPEQVAVATALAPGVASCRVGRPDSTARCPPRPTRPAWSSSSVAARTCCAPTPCGCPRRCTPTRRRWSRCAATR